MIPIPEQLKPQIKDEKVYFTIEAERNLPVKKSQVFKIIGLSFIGFALFFLLVIIFMQVLGNVSTITKTRVFGVLVSKSRGSGIGILPYLIAIPFLLLGVAIMIWNKKNASQRGGIFVATETRLLNLNNGKINVHYWKKLSTETQLDEKKQ